MTLRGYSAVLERTESPTSSVERDEARVPTPTSQDPEANLLLRERDRPTRPQRPLGAELELSPRCAAARLATKDEQSVATSVRTSRLLIIFTSRTSQSPVGDGRSQTEYYFNRPQTASFGRAKCVRAGNSGAPGDVG